MPRLPSDPVQIMVRVTFADAARLGPGKMALLEQIKATGSISAAGRAMDMSYRRAWLLVDAMNRMFDRPVVESQRGGKDGGGAVVTAFGEELLARFRVMQQKVAEVLAPDIAWLLAERAASAPAVELGVSPPPGPPI